MKKPATNKNFTDTWLQTYKPKTARDEKFDAQARGLGVRVTPTCKSFFYKRRVNGVQVRFSLGEYPHVTIHEARLKAANILASIKKGEDPRDAYRLRKPKVTEPVDETFSGAVKRFIHEYCEGKKRPLREGTIEGYKWALQRGPTKKWEKLPLADITKQMVRQEIRKLEIAPSKLKGSDHKRGASARLLRAYLSKFFNWATSEDLIVVNPVHAVTLHSKASEFERDRWLPLSELQVVLKAADLLSPVFRDFIWTLTLTGQRRGETSIMKWADLTLEAKEPTWRIPAENAKNWREHFVPLSAQLVERLGKMEKRGKYVFTTDGKTPISGFSKVKKALDAKVKEVRPDDEIQYWRIHDLRRSVATGLANHLELRPHVIEAVLNHVSGEKKGVAGIYNRSPYEADSRRALEAWAQLITAEKLDANVVALRA